MVMKRCKIPVLATTLQDMSDIFDDIRAQYEVILLARHNQSGYNTWNAIQLHLQIIKALRLGSQTTTANQDNVLFGVLLLWQNISASELLYCFLTDATYHRARVPHASKLHTVVDKDWSIEQLSESFDSLGSLNGYSCTFRCFGTALLI